MGFLFAAAALALGVGLGLLWAHGRAKAHLTEARARAATRLDEVRSRAEVLRREAAARAESERVRLVRESLSALERERQELEEHAADLDERERLADGREAAVVESEKQVEGGGTAVQSLAAEVRALAEQAQGKQRERITALEAKSGTGERDVREQLVREQVGKIELASLMRLRELEAAVSEAAPALSRRIMQIALERYDGAGHLERTQSAVPIEQREMFGLLADAAGRCRQAFLEESGCDLVCDEPTRSVTVRGDDPLARELAKRVLRQLAAMRGCDADRVRGIARQARTEIEREVTTAARRACRLLDVGRVHPDVLNLVGRLKYRLSYSQNQLKHSIEVGYLAGIIADELGLDRQAARRGGLLHDIGKAMTHDHDGSHAVLGAEVARRCGEEELIANAIGAHHNDEPPRSTLAHIVTAADALSGARPGARRESVTQYLSRIQDIQRIASRSPAVHRVDIMQAGREVRVVVAGEERGTIAAEERHNGPVLSDADIQPLAQEIACGLARELTFAGQIRVTVIRESRAVSIAH